MPGWLAVWARGWPDPASAALISGWIVLSVLALVDLAGEQGGGAGFRLIPWALVAFGFAPAVSVVRSAASDVASGEETERS